MSAVAHIPLTDDELALGRAFGDAGADAVVVGGAVRDALLGRPTADIDLVTQVTTDEIRAIAEGAGWVRSIYAVGERFGTIGLVLRDGTSVEVSRYRPAAHGLATTAERFAADALHRDFTVNAMGLDLATGEMLDPLGGRADLAAGILRSPGDPHERFAEDPVRVLRAARFVAQLGFELEPASADAAASAAPGLAAIAPERIRDELTKLLLGRFAEAGLAVSLRLGALGVVLPEIAALHGVDQPSFHDLDVFAHTAQTVAAAPATRVMRWAALLHDVGKAPARTVEADGRIRFFQHAKVGARLTQDICTRLRFSKAETAAIVHLVSEHMRLGDLDTANPRAVDRAVRRLDLWEPGATDNRPAVSAEDSLELTIADFSATAHRDEAPELRKRLASAIAGSRERGTHARVASPVTGRELMEILGLEQGLEVGAAKKAIEEAVAMGEMAPGDRDAALRVARRALKEYREE